MFTDSHAHLSASPMIEQIDVILNRAQTVNVTSIINICTNIKSLEDGLALYSKYPWVKNTAAVTPHGAEEEGAIFFPLIEKAAKEGSLIAIGETGLDYFHYKDSALIQKHFFIKHLQLALECHLPIVIHCRDAFEDFFSLIDEHYNINGRSGPGVLHCFTGNSIHAEKLVQRGWFISFSGIVTFKKSLELQTIAKTIPLENMLIETDAPWLAPQSHRGKINEPSYLPEIAQFIANLRGISLETLAQITTQNAKKIFKI